MIHCTHPARTACSRCSHSHPTSLVISLTPHRLLLLGTLVQCTCPDTINSQGRNTACAQHPDNDSHMPLSLRPSSVVATTDQMDVSTMVVTSEHREVQHTTVLCHLYKNDVFHPIPTLNCVLAFIANNKLNPPVRAYMRNGT
jgi:hypothetical protein